MKGFRRIEREKKFDPSKAFLFLALGYLMFGLLLGVVGGFQYLFPSFLKEQLSFQKTRPLHVFLVISWIFSAAKAGIYYYLPRIAGRKLFWARGAMLHFIMQFMVSITIVVCFFLGYFGGREYLEFPPWIGGCIILSWLPFPIIFFATLKPDFRTAPVYIWSWTTGIIFFFITVTESYLWLFDFFGNNLVRDITIQWKALGSMVGSWNMLVYGTAMYVMEMISNDERTCRSRIAFFFYFLGLANLMFNWGHHTYIVPAAPWVKTVAYVISMTELLILGNIIWQWRKTLNKAIKNYRQIPYRLLSFADGWIFLNLTLAIIISVPAWNYYTHGTHITVAHAMGATIGINTMILFASVFYMMQQEYPAAFESQKKFISKGIIIANAGLLLFLTGLLGSGIVKILGKSEGQSFYSIMQRSYPFFKVFTYSGIVIMAGLVIMIMAVFRLRNRPSFT